MLSRLISCFACATDVPAIGCPCYNHYDNYYYYSLLQVLTPLTATTTTLNATTRLLLLLLLQLTADC